MDTDAIDRVLAEMKAEETTDALCFVEALEARGEMGQDLADEWRRRIHAWRRFHAASSREPEN